MIIALVHMIKGLHHVLHAIAIVVIRLSSQRNMPVDEQAGNCLLAFPTSMLRMHISILP